MRNVQPLNECVQIGGTHTLSSGHFLEFFIRARNAVAAHHGLDRLGQYLPGAVQILGQTFFIELQLGKTRLQRLIGQHGMPQRHAHIAQHGGVRQVTLPAADGQFFAQVAQQGVAQAQVAFCVLEIDRVDLVWHGGRANFAFFQPLFEVTQADVAPHIARQVDQNGVAAGHCVKQLGHVVVRLNLDAVRLKRKAKPHGLWRFHYATAEGFPVNLRCRTQMRVVIADCAIHLGQQRHGSDLITRLLQPHQHVGHFLADRGGAGGLSMGAAEHGNGRILLRHHTQAGANRIQAGQHGLLPAGLELQGMAGVVNVLAGAGEMHEFGCILQFSAAVEFAPDPVFHGFHVVVGGFFDLLDGARIVHRKPLDQIHQEHARSGRQGLELRHAHIAERHEPRHLHLHPKAHVTKLAHTAA